MRRSLVLLLAAVLLAACDGPSGARDIPVQLVDFTGANPALGCGPGTLDIVVDQAELDRFVVTGVPVDASGNFDLSLPIASYAAVTRIQVTMDLEGCPDLLGAVPPFFLGDVPFVRIVVGDAYRCEDIEEPRLPTGRTDPALVALESSLYAVGGTTRGVSTDRVVPIASPLLTWSGAIPGEDNRYPVLSPRPMRAARASRLGASRVVVASNDVVFRWDADLSDRSGTGVRTLDAVHDGAGQLSAVVDLGGEGVAIVGGALGEAGAAEISWIDPDETIRITRLATPRRDPVAISAGGVLVIAGGQAEGQPLFEIARFREPGVALAGSPTDVRPGAVLIAPERRNAILLGGLSADGATVRDDTLLVTGCRPDGTGCALSEGPAWATPRLRPAVAETVGGVWLLGGESAQGAAQRSVDRVVRFGESVAIEALTEGLPTARARAGAALFADGIVAVLGGVDDSATPQEQRTLALCWPRALDPLN